MPASFAGIRPVIHTPFSSRGSALQYGVSDHELKALVRRMLGAGVDGLVVLGLASEAWTLTDREREAILDAISDAVSGAVPLVAGVDGPSHVAAERARTAAARGCSALMVLPPPWARTTAQLIEHFCLLADAARVPILVQDSPQANGVTLSIEAIVELAASHPLIGAVKSEAPGSGPKITSLVAAGLEVVAGWGGLHYLENIDRGASGCMPGCDLAPALLEIDRLARSGDRPGATRLYQAILPLLSYEAQSLELLISGAKRLLRRQRVFSDDGLRPPARALDEFEVASFDRFFEQLEENGVPGFERES